MNRLSYRRNQGRMVWNPGWDTCILLDDLGSVVKCAGAAYQGIFGNLKSFDMPGNNTCHLFQNRFHDREQYRLLLGIDLSVLSILEWDVMSSGNHQR